MSTAYSQFKVFTIRDFLLCLLATALILFALITGHKFWKNNSQLNNDLFVQNLQITVGSETIDLRINSREMMICLPKESEPHMIYCKSED